MFSVNNPELAVEDAICEAPKIHLSHLNTYRQAKSRLQLRGVGASQIKNSECKERSSKPFCFKIFKSVEFVLTLGTLVTTRTDTFLEGSSSSSFRIFFPCQGQTDSIKGTFFTSTKTFWSRRTFSFFMGNVYIFLFASTDNSQVCQRKS